MKKEFLLLAGAMLAIWSCGGGDGSGSNPPPPPPPTTQFSLSSTAFPDGGTIPAAHVCPGRGGNDRSPALNWGNLPAGTASVAIIMDDENPPCGTANNACKHWSVFNIPAAVFSLTENFDSTTISGVTEGVNYTGGNGYAGPCPPSTHNYNFTLYALAATAPAFPASTSVTRSSFVQNNATHIIDSFSLTGWYP